MLDFPTNLDSPLNTKEMIDKKGFLELFGLTIPSLDHFDYYVGQLSKSKKYRNLNENIQLWEKSEGEIGDVSKFFSQKILEITEFLQCSNPLTELNFDKNIIDFPSSRSLKYSEDSKYISVSIKDANWQAIKKYDPSHINDLGDTWSDFLDKFNLPEIAKKSNHFRNTIFTNLNNKKITKVQRSIIQEVVRQFQDDFVIEGVRNDEVIFRFEEFSELNKFQNLDQKYLMKIFTISRHDGYRVDTIYDQSGKFIERELVNLDWSLFFLKFKEHITGEKLDIRDFYFHVDGRLAIWNDPRITIQLT